MASGVKVAVAAALCVVLLTLAMMGQPAEAEPSCSANCIQVYRSCGLLKVACGLSLTGCLSAGCPSKEVDCVAICRSDLEACSDGEAACTAKFAACTDKC